MNDTPKPADTIRRDVEDNYEEYAEDEYGYTYDAWDLLSLTDVDRHDAILNMSPEELTQNQLSPASDDLDDLERWAMARAFRRHGRDEQFVDTCRRIIESDSKHPAIVYPEVVVFGARQLASASLEDALAWLREFEAATDEDELMETRILRAVLVHVVEDSSEVLDELESEVGGEPEMYYEVAEEFVRMGAPDAATNWLERASETARSLGDRATLIDVELLANEIDGPDSDVE